MLLLWLAWPAAAGAHARAPSPALSETGMGPYPISALADPDVGTGTFYVLVAMPGGESPPAGTAVTIWVEPEDGHAAEASFGAERDQTRYGERFVAKTKFDAEGPWQVRLAIDGPAGTGETSFPVRVTPSGMGWLATVACLLPFVGLGFLWLRGARRQRAAR